MADWLCAAAVSDPLVGYGSQFILEAVRSYVWKRNTEMQSVAITEARPHLNSVEATLGGCFRVTGVNLIKPKTNLLPLIIRRYRADAAVIMAVTVHGHRR